MNGWVDKLGISMGGRVLLNGGRGKKHIVYALLLAGLGACAEEPTAQKTQQDATPPVALQSAIEPIAIVANASAAGGDDLTDQQVAHYSSEFVKGLQAIERNDAAAAEGIFTELIKLYPSVVESYINLASVYVSENNLAKAETTLMQGLLTRKNHATLFENLQTLHTFQAADAYRSALNANNETQQVSLPTINTIDTSAIVQSTNKARVSELEAQLAILNDSHAKALAKERTKSRLDMSKTVELQNKYDGVKKTFQDEMARMTEQHQARIAELKQQHQTALSKQEEAHSSQLALLREQNTSAQDKLAQLEKQLAQSTLVANIENTPTPDPAPVSVSAPSDQVTDNPVTSATFDKQKAISRVKSWAKAWSDQDVAAYVSHYTDGYIPKGQNLSHQQWREQRQIRLTNKKFIKINVSDFEVDERADRIAVNFTQHYQSNTVNDKITKKLVFVQSDRDIKIVEEVIVK